MELSYVYSPEEEIVRIQDFLKECTKRHKGQYTKFFSTMKKHTKEFLESVKEGLFLGGAVGNVSFAKEQERKGDFACMTLMGICFGKHAIKGKWNRDFKYHFYGTKDFSSNYMFTPLHRFMYLYLYFLNKDQLILYPSATNYLAGIDKDSMLNAIHVTEGDTVGCGWYETWTNHQEWNIGEYVNKDYCLLYEEIVNNGYSDEAFEKFVELFMEKEIAHVEYKHDGNDYIFEKWVQDIVNKDLD